MLRAVAVLLVIGCHLTWNPLWARVGWTGVDLFFCLSGFLVSGLLFRDYKATGELHWRRFIIRRGFKIYPAYYVLIFGTVIFYWMAGTPIGWQHLWPDLFFVQDYREGTWGHLWSLGIEEQFYFLLPLCLWLMARKWPRQPFRRLPWFCGLVAAGCLAMRAIQFYAVRPFHHVHHLRPFHLRFDALFFGVLLSYLNEFRPDLLKGVMQRRGRFVLAVSMVCVLPPVLFEQQAAFLYIFGLTLLYAGFGGILLYTLWHVSGEGVVVRWLSGIGRSSYSIYLWHLPIAWFAFSVMQGRWHWDRNVVFWTYVAASLVVGIGMANAIEYPVLRMRERWFPDAQASSSKRTRAQSVSFTGVGIPASAPRRAT
jgi:peptidoglycan/LPS O-acetylase OafA/YrhL